jgi:FkbM family methyltransferase
MKKHVIQTVSLERKIKSLIPASIKKIATTMICNSVIGRLIQLIQPKSSLDGASFNYKLIHPTAAAKVYFGVWESAEIKILKRNMIGVNFLELGSSVGVTMSVIFNSTKNTKIKYVGVEASPRNYEILKNQAGYIEVQESVELINKAIDYTDNKEVEFFESDYEAGSLKEQNCKQIKLVETVKLRDIVTKYYGNAEYFLISDIEGAEAEIFLKDIDALKNCIGILCELEDVAACGIEDQKNMIIKAGFKLKERYSNVFFFSR